MTSSLLQVARLFGALHDGIVSFVESWDNSESEECDHDEEEEEVDPDAADPIKYIGSTEAWVARFEDVAARATDACVCNLSTITEAASWVMRQLEIEHAADGGGS